MSPTNLPHFEGWCLIGKFPLDDPGGVGSWLLVHGGEAVLLEVPEGLTVDEVKSAVDRSGATLRWATASHEHWDHLDEDVWKALQEAFPKVRFLHPSKVRGDRMLMLGGEPLWLIKAPKHSTCDVVAVFRGVAMTGDIETGTLDSVTEEVPLRTRKRSMQRLREFQERCGYHVHSTVSAHLNSVRTSVNWPELFECR
jgi:hydroxyacylglutathione hydrolase